jgi:hypothetical protein
LYPLQPFACAFNASCSLAERAFLSTADQFMEDWEANEGKNDPECAERRADWNAIRPLLVQAPAMLTAIRTFIQRADDLISAIDGSTGQFEPEVAGLSAATSAAEKVIDRIGRQP